MIEHNTTVTCSFINVGSTMVLSSIVALTLKMCVFKMFLIITKTHTFLRNHKFAFNTTADYTQIIWISYFSNNS